MGGIQTIKNGWLMTLLYQHEWTSQRHFAIPESQQHRSRYLYSGSPTAMTGLSFGYGIGLPLSRLHAKYLGGSLDLVSLPGYGVDVTWRRGPRLWRAREHVCGDFWSFSGVQSWRPFEDVWKFSFWDAGYAWLNSFFTGYCWINPSYCWGRQRVYIV